MTRLASSLDRKGARRGNRGDGTPAAPGAAWLATLPGRIRAGAEAALAELPADAASAGPALPVAVVAWTVADPAVAARLVEAWLATADAAGDVSPPCPLLAQLAEGVADALPDPDGFLERILPGLARGVEREFDRYDAQGTGLPQWPAAAEAWFPAEYAPGKFSKVVGLADTAAAVKVAAAGGVKPANAADYVRAGARILVTSAPYFAPPADVKVSISAC